MWTMRVSLHYIKAYKTCCVVTLWGPVVWQLVIPLLGADEFTLNTRERDV